MRSLVPVLLVFTLGCQTAPARDPAGSADGDRTFRSTEDGRRTIFSLRGCHYAGNPPIESRLLGLRQNATGDGEAIDQITVDNEARSIACPKLTILISGTGIIYPRLDSIHARPEDNCEYATNAGPVFCTIALKSGPPR